MKMASSICSSGTGAPALCRRVSCLKLPRVFMASQELEKYVLLVLGKELLAMMMVNPSKLKGGMLDSHLESQKVPYGPLAFSGKACGESITVRVLGTPASALARPKATDCRAALILMVGALCFITPQSWVTSEEARSNCGTIDGAKTILGNRIFVY